VTGLKVLALDTSTEYCSVALWDEGRADAREVWGGQHSELVLEMVDDLLVRHGLRVGDLDGIAFGEGPGSFTGLRVACAIAQGLAFACGVHVVGVSTLLAMAEASGKERVVCCLDARMREVYHAAYERTGTGEWWAVHAPGLYAPDAIPLPPGAGWHAGGSGFATYGEVLAKRLAGKLAGVDPGLHPRAEAIVRLAVPRFERGEGIAPWLAAPAYLRDKVALKSDER
jgi:tRNA threonylcarbamoyladenosine biosynthesis protein TsaB